MVDPPASGSPVPGVAPEEELFAVTIQDRDGACVLVAEGEVDVMTAPRLEAAVAEGLQRPSAMLVIDLTRVSFLGSHGLRALVETARQAHREDEPLRLVVDSNRPVIRPIQLTNLDRVLALYHSLADALSGNGQIPPEV